MITSGATIWLASAVGFIGVAALVFLARPDRSQNRLLALALFLDGLNWTMLAVRVAATSPEIATAAIITQITFLMASVFAYLAFLGTLETPLTRVLRGPRAPVVLAVCAVLFAGTSVFQPTWYYPVPLVPGPGPWRWDVPLVGGALLGLHLFHSLVLVFALVAAIHTWARTRPGTAARSRAGWYAIAFGLRDLVLLVDWVVNMLHGLAGTTPLHTAWGSVEMTLLPVSFIAFCALVAYAVLRHQLFDIDLKIKWTLRRGTVVGALAAVFFLVKEAVEAFVPGEGALAGIFGAAVVAALLYPAWTGSSRLVERLMPGVADTNEYRTVRKREVYRAALDEVMADGDLSEKDRNVLTGLADRLGLSNEDAQSLKR